MKKIIPLLLLLLFVLVSCKAGFQRDTPESSTAYTGTKGLELRFVQNYPPSLIYASGTSAGPTPYNLLLEVFNKGTYQTAADIYLSGYDTKIFTNLPPQTSQAYRTTSLEGKSAINPEGDFEQLSFPQGTGSTMIIQLPEGTDQLPVNFFATACYDYKTQATPVVCIDPDPFNTILQKACVPKGASVGGGQGAPVAVTSVQQESVPGKVIFKIGIANADRGQVIEESHVSSCLETTFQNKDKVAYQVSLSGTAPQTCKPGSPVTLINNKATVTCTFNVQGNLAYQTPLEIDLDYGYISTAARQVQVRKIA